MNKKGFTLVELLAVVVVLAVVSIIAIPITINIIENARKGALEESAKGLMDAASNYYALHGKDITDYVDFSIVNGKQTSTEKLNYKGSIDNGYLRLVDAKTMALCIDDNKYYAVKNLDSKDITVDEGICTSEYDEDLLGYVVGGSGNYVGLRLDVKAYTSSGSLPNRAKEGSVAVITDKRITSYYASSDGPETPQDGMVWVVLDNKSSNKIKTKTSSFGVGYVVQYDNNAWVLKESYVYNDAWEQLTSYGGSVYEWNYEYTGHYETFEAPFSGYYTIELWGASGGDYNVTYVGGNGAYTKGDLYLNAGEIIYVYVGGQGGSYNSVGWNGGGKGYNTYGYAGGGATDVRTVATSAPTTWNETASLRTRIMVAGGGGGASFYNDSNWPSSGGSAGGLESYVGSGGSSAVDYRGTVATQLTAGVGSSAGYTGGSGSLGKGGDAYTNWTNSGGGGGYYGGAGGSHAGGLNSGGSSYISGHRGCVSIDENLHVTGSNNSYTGKYFVNTVMIDGKGYSWTTKKGNYTGMPNYADGTTMASNDGPGYARIKFKKFTSLTETQEEEIGASVQNVWLYDYMGYYQEFVAPKTGIYKFELWGAQGGTYNATYHGGLGGYTSGNMRLTKGQTLYIFVGSQGVGGGVGWNGGGQGYNSYGYGGGGATDIRTTVTNALTNWNGIDSLKTRIMVAAGGGGASYYNDSNWPSSGGAAGGLESSLGTGGTSAVDYRGTVATQIKGGVGSSAGYTGGSGSFGIGGSAYTNWTNGGGGAGWYGGAGGSHAGGLNSGGSSYISGHNGCIGMNIDTTMKTNDSVSYTGYEFTNTKMIDGEGYEWKTSKSSLVKMPTHDGETLITGNSGNGYAKVTYVD